MTSTTTIHVTREYKQDPPEVYSVQLAGNLLTEHDIAQQLLSVSLSSPNLNSYAFEMNEEHSKAIVWHNRPSHHRLNVCDHPFFTF